MLIRMKEYQHQHCRHFALFGCMWTNGMDIISWGVHFENKVALECVSVCRAWVVVILWRYVSTRIRYMGCLFCTAVTDWLSRLPFWFNEILDHFLIRAKLQHGPVWHYFHFQLLQHFVFSCTICYRTTTAAGNCSGMLCHKRLFQRIGLINRSGEKSTVASCV